MADRTFYRRSCSRLDYTFEFDEWLTDGDTIISYTLTVTEGDLVIDGDSESGGIITYFVTGTAGEVQCEIETAGTLEDCRCAKFIQVEC